MVFNDCGILLLCNVELFALDEEATALDGAGDVDEDWLPNKNSKRFLVCAKW